MEVFFLNSLKHEENHNVKAKVSFSIIVLLLVISAFIWRQEIQVYAWPHELGPKLVIGTILILVLAVIGLGFKIWNIAQLNIRTLDKISDVSILEKALLQNNVDPDKAFHEFEEKNGKSNKTEVLFDHVKAIYDAGRKSSHLEPELLVKNTIDKIFTNIDILKTIISMFLVIGILGTLIGLAISIGGFSGANFTMIGQTSSTANELSNLFTNLRGAFAPSMWGVGATILFVFLYIVYIQELCINKLTEKLTITTIKNWLPVLYPTDFQRGDNSLAKLNATVKNADGINKGVSELQNNLSESNKTLQALTRASAQVQEATEKFDKSTDKIANITAIYDALQSANEEFKKSLQHLVEVSAKERKDSYKEYLEQSQKNYADLESKFDQLTQNMRAYFAQLSNFMKEQNTILSSSKDDQQKQLLKVVDCLNAYDTNVLQHLSDIPKEMKEMSTYVRQLAEYNNSIVSKNMEAVETMKKAATVLTQGQEQIKQAVSTPIIHEVNEMSLNIKTTLENIAKKIDELRHPMDGMKVEIHNTFQDMLNSLSAQNKLYLDKMKSNLEETKKIEFRIANQLNNPKLSPEERKAQWNTFSSPSMDSGDISKKLDILIQAMEENTKQVKKQSAKDNTAQPFWRKHLVAIVIAALLVISVGVQTAIVVKLGNLEQTQVEVNKVLMRGDMNSNGTTGQ